MRSRNTKGFKRRPKSDGDMRRVMGPWFCPRVRLAMRVTAVSWDFKSSMGSGLSKFGLSGFAGRLKCGRPPQQVINHRQGLFLKLGESCVHVTALEMRPKSRDGDVDR